MKYDDRKDSDERYWAAVELYKLTGEKRFHDALLSITENVIPTELGFGKQLVIMAAFRI